MGTRRALPPAGQRTNLTTPPRQQGPRAPGYATHSADRTGRPDRAAPRRSRQQNPRPLRGGRVLRPRALPLPGSGTSAAPAPRSVRVMPPQGGPPDLTPHGRGDSRSTGPGCLPCQGPPGRRTRGRDTPIMNQQRNRAAATPTTTQHAPPTPQQAPSTDLVVAGCLYEAGFTTTGPGQHPQGGVAPAASTTPGNGSPTC